MVIALIVVGGAVGLLLAAVISVALPEKAGRVLLVVFMLAYFVVLYWFHII